VTASASLLKGAHWSLAVSGIDFKYERADDEQTYAAIGAAIDVHRELGCGFLEAVYREALTVEFIHRQIPFAREPLIHVYYKGCRLPCGYRPDFLCFDQIVIELKAAAALTGNDQAQVLNYLKATGFARGLLFNFGKTSLEFKRLVRS
jgi:GxxExxY protein